MDGARAEYTISDFITFFFQPYLPRIFDVPSKYKNNNNETKWLYVWMFMKKNTENM